MTTPTPPSLQATGMNLFLDIKHVSVKKCDQRRQAWRCQVRTKPLSSTKIKGPAHEHGEDGKDEQVSQEAKRWGGVLEQNFSTLCGEGSSSALLVHQTLVFLISKMQLKCGHVQVL